MKRHVLEITTALLLLISILGASPALAQDPLRENRLCLTCHGESISYTLPSGEPLSLYVDEDTFHASVHGQQELACIDCHTDITEYPHDYIESWSKRDFQLDQYPICKRCHPGQYELILDSMHMQELAGGNQGAAICTDCHGAHNVTPPDQPRQKISLTCGKCHTDIFEQYKGSVHGEALLEEGNSDVPTCVDCHGVHNIHDPRTATFRSDSPKLCASCHASAELMDKYGIAHDVFETYVADFHGTTLQLFEPDPDTPPRQAVCFDCHGIHNISRVDDPETGLGIKENLIATCQKCHPDAAANFPDAWLSHYEPSPEHSPTIYYTEIFFTILTSSTVVALIGHMTLDFGRLLAKRLGSGKY